MYKSLIAELFGTFCLVLVGTGAIVVSDMYQDVIGHVGVAAAFGLVVMAMIYTVGDVSGAHLNPAVTIGFFIAGRFPGKRIFPYIVAQCLGAILASAALFTLFPDHNTMGATLPDIGLLRSFVVEVVITLVLMMTILSVTRGSKEEGITAAMAIGGVVALAALIAGPLTGASMNPARSLGPALFSGQLSYMWLYILAPIVGAGLAFPLCRSARDSECCAGCTSTKRQAS